MLIYSERLLPGPWPFITTALVIPASLIVFLPINQTLGVICGAILYTIIVVPLILGSPRIEVTDTLLIAGRARLPLPNVGEATGYQGTEATAQRGPRLDARAWLL